MWHVTFRCLARVYAGGSPLAGGGRPPPVSSHAQLRGGLLQRQGSLFSIAETIRHDETKLRQTLNQLVEDDRRSIGNRAFEPTRPSHGSVGVPQRSCSVRPLVNLPGVEHVRDLPADPITRLFFQAKGDHALYYGTLERPHPGQLAYHGGALGEGAGDAFAGQDADRVRLERRTAASSWEHERPSNQRNQWVHQVFTPVYDFCHRVREGAEQRKRFVVVPASLETKGCAQVMLRHGLIAGMRDFHNTRAFAVELKYMQNESTINVIEPCSIDGKVEFEWSPKMMRRLLNTHGIHNRLVVYICRTADNRIIDHIQAVKEHIGGRGLMMVH